MTKKNAKKQMLFHFIVIIFILFCFSSQTTAHAEVIFITNNATKIDNLTQLQIKDIFLGRLVTSDIGWRIKFVVLRKSSTHKEFTIKYMKKSQSQFKMTWRKIVFTGKGLRPKSFKSENDLVTYVRNTEGVIGYVSSGTPVDGLKTINVIDK